MDDAQEMLLLGAGLLAAGAINLINCACCALVIGCGFLVAAIGLAIVAWQLYGLVR